MNELKYVCNPHNARFPISAHVGVGLGAHHCGNNIFVADCAILVVP
jgi:hypothetical protein